MDVHSKQLEDVNQPCSLQEHYKQDGTSVPSSALHVLSSQETQLMQKHTVDSRCVVATCKKEGKKSYSQLDGIKCGKEVDLPAESVSTVASLCAIPSQLIEIMLGLN